MFMATFVLYRGLYQMISLWRFFFVGLAFCAVTVSGGSRPSDKGGGGGHPDPEIRVGGGGSQKNCFGPLGLSLV